MKYSKLLAALVAVTLVACTKKKDEDSTPVFPVVPADIQFNKGGLSGISDADFAEGMRLFTALAEMDDVSAHLLIANESTEDAQKRQERFDKLSDEQKAFIEAQRNGCTITDEPGGPNFGEGAPIAGQSSTWTNKEEVTGANCGVDALNLNNGLMTILSKPNDNAYEVGGRFSVSFNSSIRNPADQALMGYSSLKFSGVSESRTSLDMGQEKTSYTKTNLTGEGNLAVGHMDLRWNMEDLNIEATDTHAKIASIEVSKDGKTYVLSAHIRTKGGIKFEEYFIGNRQLTADEVTQIRSFLQFD